MAEKKVEIGRGAVLSVLYVRVNDDEAEQKLRALVEVESDGGSGICGRWVVPLREANYALRAMSEGRHIVLHAVPQGALLVPIEVETLPGAPTVKAKGIACLDQFPRVTVEGDTRSWATSELGRKAAALAYAEGAEIEIIGPNGDPYDDHTVRRVG